MSVKQTDPSQSQFIHFLRWIMEFRRTPVKAMENALRFRRLLRFISMGSFMILLPSVLLAYFGISSIHGEELAMVEDVQIQAEGASSAFIERYERSFTSFETRVLNRLEAGHSPLERPTELHPHMLVALKLSSDLTVKNPFYRPSVPGVEPINYLFDADAQRANAAERRGEDAGVVARLYGRAARASSDSKTRARLLFDRARMLTKARRYAEAADQLKEVNKKYGQMRDPWGFRMIDLTRLHEAESMLERDRLKGAEALRRLVVDLMASSWAVGEGGEAAVARRALSRLEPFTDAEWVAGTRERIDAQTRMLYWAQELLPELDKVLMGRRNMIVGRGEVRWIEGERGLWALTWWDDELYAFALDRSAIIANARKLAIDGTPSSSPVKSQLLEPGTDSPDEVLSRRSLVPWLIGWQMVVLPRDAVALAEDLRQRRSRRIAIIVLAVVMMGVGAMVTARMVRNELGNARMKADFAANVSHELRSPITQIRLKAESLMLGLSETEDERQHDYRAIVRESERLSRLVDNVLDFSAIERGAKTYQLNPGDFTDTVHAAIESIESSFELKDRELILDIDSFLPLIAHDMDAIAQCVINLVSNAAKYSDADRPIRVTLERVGDGVQLCVIDQGIGIPSADLRQIFEPFFRGGDAAVRRRKGTGIGLAITFYIVQAHMGTVDVVSTPGKGSTFSLWFPGLADNHRDQ
jgi:signal transduction histidine kinase